MNSNTIVGAIVVAVVLVGGYFLFSRPMPEDVSFGPIKIGFTMPLSGEAASYGESGRAGAELAIKEINAAGGINDRMIEGVFEDDKCSPTGVSAAQKLINVDKVVAIVGPVCSPVAGAANPVIREAGVPSIMIGASAPGLAGGADSVFSDYASDVYQGKFAAEYISGTLGKKKVAVLYVKNEWGQGLHDVFTKRFPELGGEVVFDEGAAGDSKDVKAAVAKIKAANPDVIYLPAFPALAVVAVKQLREGGVTAPIIGGDALEAGEFLNSGVAEGVMYFTGAVGNPDEFKAKIKAQSNIEPNIVGPLAYDAVYVLAEVIKNQGTAKVDIISGLNALTYTKGISSKSISFDENGDLEGAMYDVKVVKNGKPEVVAQ